MAIGTECFSLFVDFFVFQLPLLLFSGVEDLRRKSNDELGEQKDQQHLKGLVCLEQ